MSRTLMIAFACLLPAVTYAQGGGSFAGTNSYQYGYSNQQSRSGPASRQDQTLTTEQALSVIQISGKAQVRIRFEGIRLVLALTAQGKSAEECRNTVLQQISDTRRDLAEMNIAGDHVIEDFINVLPVFQWKKSERDGEQVRLQTQTGYRTQSNLHVSVKTEAEALQVIRRAYANGDCEVVTFDYWSSDLDEQKEKAREQAVAAAQRKAKTLLAVFDEKPRVINIQESTQVRFPQQLYRTYENVLQEELTEYRSDRTTRIKAFRPKMTFLEGVSGQTDAENSAPVMQPEIIVQSSVTIYYRSPAAGNAVSQH